MHAEMVENSERHAGGDALAIRGNFMQRLVAVSLGNRAAPVELMRGEIIRCYRAAMLAREGRDALGKFAAIESLAPRLCDHLQRARGRRRLEDFAGARGTALRHELL